MASDEGVVLHDLRLAPFSDPAAVADRTGLAVAPVEAALAALDAAGLVRHRSGVPAGWAPTPAGRAAAARAAAAELDAAGARASVEAAYRRFLALNGPFLQACTDWQIRDLGRGQRNDHADPAYDAAVLDRLDRLVRDLAPVLADLAAALDRFGRYGPRVDRAWARVRGGEPDWLFAPTRDSLHTVWFALHEDLLVTLGIERGREP